MPDETGGDEAEADGPDGGLDPHGQTQTAQQPERRDEAWEPTLFRRQPQGGEIGQGVVDEHQRGAVQQGAYTCLGGWAWRATEAYQWDTAWSAQGRERLAAGGAHHAAGRDGSASGTGTWLTSRQRFGPMR